MMRRIRHKLETCNADDSHFRGRRKMATITCTVIIGVLVALDILTPIGSSYGPAYIVVVLESMRSRDPKLIKVFALLTCVAVLLGFALSPRAEIPIEIALINRIASVFSVCVVAFLGIKVTQLTQTLSHLKATARVLDP